jgi:hypothetical protein
LAGRVGARGFFSFWTGVDAIGVDIFKYGRRLDKVIYLGNFFVQFFMSFSGDPDIK